MLQELEFGPGVYVDDSALVARGRYVAANQIRFVRGKAQTRYGNEKFSTTSLTGIARGIWAWADNSKNPYLSVGTHLRLYASDANGTVTDITPVESYGTLTNPFTTDGTTATITVTHTSHGLNDGTLVKWPYLSGTVNGATVTTTTRYSITKIDADSYSFSADTVSTSAGAATTGVTDYEYGLTTGNVDGLAGAGFGTGGYGSGGYGSASTDVTLFPRTWSFAYWGQNLLANPRGKGIFEWAPNVTSSELLTNGIFSTGGGGFTASGVGWSIGGLQANASATSSTLTQTITESLGAWHLLYIRTTITSGSFVVVSGTTTIQSCTATGNYAQPFYNGGTASRTITIYPNALVGNLRSSSIKVLTTAQRILPSAPNPVTCIFSTSERIVVACGVNDNSGNFDPMRVRWSDRENNQLWTAAASNLAGQYPLTNGSRIVGGMAGNGENLIWTDTCLYAMRWVPDPNAVYDFVEIGPGCGLLGPNARCVLNGVVYWRAPNGQDYMYNGGIPTPITSNTMRRDFNDNLAWVQQDKVFSASISAWNEVQHLYPDSRDGTECSRYNKHNTAEDCWDPGLTTFTCWLDQGVFQFPIAVDTSGYIRYCEKGNSVDGGPFSWSLRSAKVRQDGGYKGITINGVHPDAAGLLGGYQMNFYASWKDIRGAHTKTFGPISANSASGNIPVHAKGQYLQIEWTSTASAPTFWRAGADLFDVSNSGESR